MRDFEGNGSECPLRPIPLELVTAHPVVPLAMAFHITPPEGNRVATNRLAAEGRSVRLPVLERARFEVQIERSAVGAPGYRSFGLRGLLGMKWRKEKTT